MIPMTIARRIAVAALMATSGIVSPTAATAQSPSSPAANASVLGTPAQLSAEETLLTLLGDPAVKAIEARLVADLSATPTGQTPDGRARIAHAVALWTNSLILRELSADPAKPDILWVVDNTPHSWFGHTIDGMAVAGDNPDHIYRGTFVDGAGKYEIIGKVDPAHRPAQFSFEVTPGLPGKLVLQAQTAGHADMGGQIAMLTDHDIKVDADGTFRLTVGGPAGQTNTLPLKPGPISINIRDVLSDWNQRPNRLTIRRLDSAAVKPLDAAALRQRVLDDLDSYVRFWGGFKDTWFGGLKPNTIVGPVARDGNWGFLAAGRFSLAPDEAVVITTTRGAARYTGIQVTDPWMIASDATRHQTSINLSQAAPNADGTFTYVVSPTDPGVANWVDTAGLHDGYVLLRWQGFDADAKSDGLLRDFRVVKLSEVGKRSLAAGPGITPAVRRAQIEKRAVQYGVRLK